MNKPRMAAAGLEDVTDAVFLSEVFLSDKLYLQTVFSGDPLGIATQLIPERFGKTGVIEDFNFIEIEESCHASGVAESWQGSLNDNTVVAGEYTRDFIGIAFS